MTGDDDHEAARGFMERWSRRKRAPESQPDPEDVARAEAAARAEAEAAQKAEAEDTRTDEEILRDLKLPDPDTLGMGDDFKVFMAPGVPQRFRQRALRRLWTSNPVLANLDGLNDYDGDYTGKVPGGLVEIGNIKTAYKVGRGLMRAVDKIIDEGKAERVADAAAPQDTPHAPDTPQPISPDDAGTAQAVEGDADTSPDAGMAQAAPARPAAPPAEPEQAPPPRTLRRMAFRPVPTQTPSKR